VRYAFHARLQQLGAELADMCSLAAEAMRQATYALLETDTVAAKQVLARDAALDAARDECEGEAQALLALQAPVASDLRTVLATVYCAEKIERMGDLARHVAAVVELTDPVCAVPTPLTNLFADLGRLTVAMAEQLQHLMTSPSVAGFAELVAADDQVDALHERLMEQITSDDWAYGISAATNLALLGRFYERFADQIVSVARRLTFAAVGTYPE
jgi:phosphate transport system protein